MKHLRVHLQIQYESDLQSVEVCYNERSGFSVSIRNRIFQIHKKGKRWMTTDKGLLLHMDTIAANYHETIKLFKWYLPEPLKEAIYVVEIKMSVPLIDIQLEFGVDANKFVELLRHHLIYKRIRLRAPILIHDGRTNQTIAFDLGLKPKQSTPELAPLSDNEMSKLIIKPQ